MTSPPTARVRPARPHGERGGLGDERIQPVGVEFSATLPTQTATLFISLQRARVCASCRCNRHRPRPSPTDEEHMADEIDYKLIGDDLQGVIITLDPGEAVV